MHITQELNEKLTQTGPGTPMGEVLRRYGIPALFPEEIEAPDGPPARARVLSEDLVASHDSSGETGLVEAYCAHRLAPLFTKRLVEAVW